MNDDLKEAASLFLLVIFGAALSYAFASMGEPQSVWLWQQLGAGF